MPTFDQNGVEISDTNAQIQAMYPGLTVTPSQYFQFNYNGSIVEFFAGVTQVVDATLLAQLTAAGAPFVQP
jgi:hypothetical protein